MLAKKEEGDEVATDDEENFDPEEAPCKPRDSTVEEEYRDHSQCPQAVEARQIAARGSAGCVGSS
jgi:hypothetical protein